MDAEEVASQKYFAIIWFDFDRSIESFQKLRLKFNFIQKLAHDLSTESAPHPSSCLLTALICYQFQLGLILHITQPNALIPMKGKIELARTRRWVAWRDLLSTQSSRLRMYHLSWMSYKNLNKIKSFSCRKNNNGYRTVNRAGRGSDKKEEEGKAGSQKHKLTKSFGEMSRLRQDRWTTDKTKDQ